MNVTHITLAIHHPKELPQHWQDLVAGRVESMSWVELCEVVPSGWQPIETAPVGKTMFTVKAFQAPVMSTTYDSDPWCVWQERKGEFLRWPHKFPPTHWMPLAHSPVTSRKKA